MRWANRQTTTFFVVLVVLAVLGAVSLGEIPFYRDVQMLDFHNLYQFHHCVPAIQDGPYGLSGKTCGDVGDRSVIYPPLMYWSFAWIRYVRSYGLAAGIWRATLIGLMLAVGGLWILWWTRGQERVVRLRIVLSIVWVVILTQFPFVFAVERGNNDVLVVAAWTAVAASILGTNYLLAGFAAGIAFALKLYPAVAIAILLAGLLGSNLRRTGLFGLGLALGIGVPSLVLLRDTKLFVQDVLPATLRESASGLSVFAHSLHSLPVPGLVLAGLAIAVILPWIAAAFRRFSQAPMIVLAGGLAISTYFGKLSYDYNLVTVLPLILLVLAMGIVESRLGPWKVLGLVAFGVFLAGRDLLTPIGLIVGQSIVLGLIGLAVAIQPTQVGEDAQSRELYPESMGTLS